MKVSQRADHLRLVLKHHTALDLCRFQVVKGPGGTIGNPFVSFNTCYSCYEMEKNESLRKCCE